MFNNFEGRDRSKTIKKPKVPETGLESSFKIIDELKQSIDISEKSKESANEFNNDDRMLNPNRNCSKNLNLSEKSIGLEKFGSSKDNSLLLNHFSNIDQILLEEEEASVNKSKSSRSDKNPDEESSSMSSDSNDKEKITSDQIKIFPVDKDDQKQRSEPENPKSKVVISHKNIEFSKDQQNRHHKSKFCKPVAHESIHHNKKDDKPTNESKSSCNELICPTGAQNLNISGIVGEEKTISKISIEKKNIIIKKHISKQNRNNMKSHRDNLVITPNKKDAGCSPVVSKATEDCTQVNSFCNTPLSSNSGVFSEKIIQSNKYSTRNNSIHERFMSLGNPKIIEALPKILKKTIISNADLMVSPGSDSKGVKRTNKHSLIDKSQINKDEIKKILKRIPKICSKVNAVVSDNQNSNIKFNNFKARFGVRKYNINQSIEHRVQCFGSPIPMNNDEKKLNLNNIFNITKKRILSPVSIKSKNCVPNNRPNINIKDSLKYKKRNSPDKIQIICKVIFISQRMEKYCFKPREL